MKNLNNFLIIFIFLLSFEVLSQNNDLGLNQEFLDSLPEETRDELLKQLDQDQQNLERVDFGVVSTMMKKTPAERYIEQELIEEQGLNIPPHKIRLDQLKVFGSEFFSGFSPSTFMPTSEPALSGEYILDIGDTLDINFFGGFNEVYSDLVISTDGNLAVQEIGVFQFAGKSIAEAQAMFNDIVKSKLPGVTAYIQLKELRSMQVVLVGNIVKPGIYTLAGNSNILSALRAAGGINAKGSFRNIIHKRNGAVINEYDLYELFINGNLSFSSALRSGDTIVVTPSGRKVAIYGGITNPAIYEAKNNDSLSDIIMFAGGGLNGKDIDEINLSRLTSQFRESFKITKEKFNTVVLDRDQIFIPYFEEPPFLGVKLLGAFSASGVYSVDNINQNREFLLPSKEAYTNTYFLKKAINHNQFNYIPVNPNEIPILNPGDILTALSIEDVDFLQSSYIHAFFNNDSNSQMPKCDLFEKLNEARNSNRFNKIKNIFLFNDPNPMKDNIPNQLPNLDMIDNSSVSDGLFFNKDIDKNKDFCRKVFDDDPELFFAAILNSVFIDGPNIKGGIFPIYSEINLGFLINGLTKNSSLFGDETVSVSSQGVSSTFSLGDIGAKKISFGSNITISSKKTVNSNRVSISGEVNMPGTYFISPGDRLSDLIKRAGGYSENAYPLGGHLSRLSAKEFEIEYNKRLYREIIKNLSSEIIKGGVIPFETISYILNEFQSIEPSGRVIAEFNEPKLNQDISLDLILENGDAINIPKKSNVVYVFGEVLNPGPQIFLNNGDVNQYISSAGGFTRLVDHGSIIIVYPDGKSELVNNGFFGGNQRILPGSVIYASRDLRKLDNLSLASTLAPIVSSIAISLASLNSISNN